MGRNFLQFLILFGKVKSLQGLKAFMPSFFHIKNSKQHIRSEKKTTSIIVEGYKYKCTIQIHVLILILILIKYHTV